MTEPLRQPFSNPFGIADRLSKHKAVTGLNARVRWWQRIGSLILLVIVVVMLGVLQQQVQLFQYLQTIVIMIAKQVFLLIKYLNLV